MNSNQKKLCYISWVIWSTWFWISENNDSFSLNFFFLNIKLDHISPRAVKIHSQASPLCCRDTHTLSFFSWRDAVTLKPDALCSELISCRTTVTPSQRRKKYCNVWVTAQITEIIIRPCLLYCICMLLWWAMHRRYVLEIAGAVC